MILVILGHSCKSVERNRSIIGQVSSTVGSRSRTSITGIDLKIKRSIESCAYFSDFLQFLLLMPESPMLTICPRHFFLKSKRLSNHGNSNLKVTILVGTA